MLEREDGAIAEIEVKASATVTTGDFSGLRKLTDAAGKRFAFGVVLYDSDTIVPFGESLPRHQSLAFGTDQLLKMSGAGNSPADALLTYVRS